MRSASELSSANLRILIHYMVQTRLVADHTTSRHGLKTSHSPSKFRRLAARTVAGMVRFTEGQMTNARSQKLRTIEYIPDQLSRPLAVVVWHHGYGEHSGRYATGLHIMTVHVSREFSPLY